MKLEPKYLDSEDVNKSRKEVDRVYKIYKEGLPFTESDFEEALRKASQRTRKAKPSPESA